MGKKWFLRNLNKNYFLNVGKKSFRCQIGSQGLENSSKKIEGDKKTPIGKWFLVSVFYRPDRILRPKFKKKNILKINKITKLCAWCDDIRSQYYNRYLKINNLRSPSTHHEKLWRDDEAYDIIIVVSHNFKPTIKNKGSAIFIHCSFNDYRNTAGCIAMEKKDLLFLLKNLQEKTYIKIQ